MTFNDDTERNRLQPPDCPHLRWTTDEVYGAGTITVTTQCDACGVAAVERYRFTEGYTLYADGTKQRFYL